MEVLKRTNCFFEGLGVGVHLSLLFLSFFFSFWMLITTSWMDQRQMPFRQGSFSQM